MGVPVEAAQYYANLKKRRDVSQIAVLRIETTEPYSHDANCARGIAEAL